MVSESARDGSRSIFKDVESRTLGPVWGWVPPGPSLSGAVAALCIPVKRQRASSCMGQITLVTRYMWNNISNLLQFGHLILSQMVEAIWRRWAWQLRISCDFPCEFANSQTPHGPADCIASLHA